MKTRVAQWTLWGVLMLAGVSLQAAPPRQSPPISQTGYLGASYVGVYGGRVWHGDGCGCDLCYDPCWDPCRPHCTLGIIPAAIRSVDRVLYSLFAGFRCGGACCGGCTVSGCGECCGGAESWDPALMPAPEMSDMPVSRYYSRPMSRGELRSGREPAYYPSYYPSAQIRSRTPARSEPRAPSERNYERSQAARNPDFETAPQTPRSTASGLRAVREPITLSPVESSLQPASFEAPVARPTRNIPHNPLRD